MVPLKHPGKDTGANPRHRRHVGTTMLACNGRVYATHPHSAAGHLRGGVVSRTGEYIEWDAQGVVLVKMGERHVIHLWGDEPGAYIPR